MQTAGYNAIMALAGGLLGLGAALFGSHLAASVQPLVDEPYPTGDEPLPEIDGPSETKVSRTADRPDLTDRGRYTPQPLHPEPSDDDLHLLTPSPIGSPENVNQPVDPDTPQDNGDNTPDPISEPSPESPLARGIRNEEANLQRALAWRDRVARDVAEDLWKTAKGIRPETPPTPKERAAMIRSLAEDVVKAVDEHNHGEAISKSAELIARILGGRDPRFDITVQAAHVLSEAGAVGQDLTELYQAHDAVENGRNNLNALKAKAPELERRAQATDDTPPESAQPPKPPAMKPPPTPVRQEPDGRELDKAVFDELPRIEGVPQEYRDQYRPHQTTDSAQDEKPDKKP